MKIIGTKAQTLKRLQPLVSKATILDQVIFTVKEWRGNPDEVLTRITKAFTEGYLIIRSSALVEDSLVDSHAGKFRSESGIRISDEQSICTAVESVISSYAENGGADDLNEVLVQPYIEDVALSGVLFTRTPYGAPYIVVNYDDTTKRTDTVTSGKGTELKETIIYRHSPALIVPNQFIARLIEVASELLMYGARLKIITRNISLNKSVSAMRLWGIALSRLHKNQELQVVSSAITHQDLENCGASYIDLGGVVNLMNSIPDSKAAILFFETPEGGIRASLRTEKNNVDIAKIARLFGGGGHKKAAGFTIDGKLKLKGREWEIILK